MYYLYWYVSYLYNPRFETFNDLISTIAFGKY